MTETFQGKTVWQGDVEAFSLTGHPKAAKCYGWSYGEPEQFITILELPPVKSAHDAVKVGVSYQVKKGCQVTGKIFQIKTPPDLLERINDLQ